MVDVKFNDAEVEAALSELSARLSDMTPVFEVLGDLLEDSTEKRFDEGVSPEGIPWAPKSQATIDNYIRQGLSVDPRPLHGPNLDTLPLRRSFFHDAGRDQLVIGTNKIQAAVMHFGAAKGAFGTTSRGSPIPWGRIPARPFVGISSSDRAAIVATVEEWLEEAAED
ncbi:phage virion morphogenesis protein [Roseobacter sp. YSTF-M11]|uniref:Phage virion morphogenesis protein n=1 Tax=Roseobacter insulae TaxID=2859783 RepID=A0A9X1K0W7_9RHOB|nr:phage virion morphogenesis protein [Roseobacter insulae]MBW4708629.1 phage virion morphogenesis protein [Roseobacter insulae]